MAAFDKSKSRTLIATVCAFALMVALAFWAAAYVLVQHDLNRTLAEIDDENRNLTRALTETAARIFDYADRIALQVGTAGSEAARRAVLAMLARDGGVNRNLVAGVFVADARGDVRLADTPLAQGTNVADREHFIVHRDADNGRPVISRPLLMRSSGRPGIALSRRLNRPDGGFDGIVSVVIDPAAFTRLFRDIDLGEKGLIVLTGLDGFIRVRNSGDTDVGGQDVSKGQLFAAFAKGDAGVVRYSSLVDRVTRRVAFRKLDGYPLVLSAGVAEETVLAEVHARRRNLYFGAAGGSLLAWTAAAALLLMLRRRERDALRLADSEARYRNLVEQSPDAIFINRADRIVYANPAALHMLGAASAAEVIGKSPLEIVHPDDRAAASARIDSLESAIEVTGVHEQRFVRIDGSVVETELSVSRVLDRGLPARQVVAREVGARKAIEHALRDSEERFRQLFDLSPDASFLARGEWVIAANAAMLRLLGAERPAQVVGQSIYMFMHPDYRAELRRHVERLESDPDYVRPGLVARKYLRFDGSAVEVENSATTVELPEGRARLVVARDVTQRRQMEAALRDSEERYRLMVDASPDAVIIYEDERVVYVNAAAVRLLGATSQAQLVGRSMFELIHPSGHATALARRAFVVRSGQPTGLFEQTYVRLDGTAVEVEGSTILIPGKRQRQIALRDISARKRAEAALHESEARMRMAVEAADMTNWEWDLASDQTHWGFGHEKLLGPLAEHELKYPDFRTMVHADDRTRFLAAGRATIEHGVPYDVEFRLVRTDGVVRWMRHTGRAVRDADGRIEGIAGIMQDLTRRHDVEQALALSRQRGDALMESIPAPAWLKDRSGRFIAVNRAWYRRYGKDPGWAVGRTIAEVFPGPFAEEREREDAAVIASGRESRVERIQVIDGEERWVETVKTPVFDDAGEVSAIVGVSYDTTERKRAEQELRASEERFRQFADAMDDVFWIHELEPGRADYVNRAFERIWGLAPERLLGNPELWSDLIEADDRDRVKTLFAAWVADDAAGDFKAEYRILRADGGRRWIRHFGTKLRDAAGKPYRLQGIAEDITEQRETERALAETRRRRDALLESNPEPAWLKDLQGRYIAVNRAWFLRRGLTPFNIEGKTDDDFFAPERVQVIIDEDRLVAATRQVMRSERNWVYPDGTEWLETIKAPVLDDAGNVTAIVGLSHDITERKRSEQAVQEMNQTLARQTTELTALNKELESFAYTVSHDLRAPLRHIDGFINLLRVHAGDTLDAKSKGYFDRVGHAARRMGLLIDDLLAFSRTGRAELRLQRVSLDRLLREAIDNLKPDTAERRIEWKIGTLPEVQGDAGLLAIVLQNLVSNAVKYTRPREVAEIEIRARRIDAGMTTLSVRDNGVGFDMQYRHKLFGVFQRLHTDAEFEGTGIGLATVARIVQRHGGRVWAEGRPDQGSCFFVALPLAPKPVEGK